MTKNSSSHQTFHLFIALYSSEELHTLIFYIFLGV